jgi:hypothetical protein
VTGRDEAGEAGSGRSGDASGGLPTTPVDVAHALREAADRLMRGWTAVARPPVPGEPSERAVSPGGGGSAVGGPGSAGVPALPDPLVPPATSSAAQLQAVLDDLAARRAQVQALRAQLGLFDEQLAALETSLGPLLEWTRAWAGMERTMTDLWRPPPGPI